MPAVRQSQSIRTRGTTKAETQSATSKPFTLSYVKTIGLVTNQPVGRGFANPYDIATTKDERIYVLNRGAGGICRVGIVNLEEDYLGELGSFGDKDGQFKLPVSIALDSQGQVHVTDEYHHRVSVFDSSGKFLRKWGNYGTGLGQLNGPAGITIDSQDRVYIANQHSNRVEVFTAEGRYLASWGEPGKGNGQFNMPWGVCVDSHGNVYVADWRNDRIQKFTSEGNFLAAYGQSGQADGQFYRPSSVAVDSEGYIYVADWGNHRVQVFSPSGSFVIKLRGQATVSKWAEEFFAANPDEWKERQKSNLLPELPPHLRTPYHESSQIEPYFWGPVCVELDTSGRLYVAETNRHRIQVYQKG